MATVNDKYLLTLRAHSIQNTQAIQNVFAYQLTAGPGGAVTLAERFRDSVLPDIIAVIDGDTLFDDVYVVNLDDATDFATVSINGNGSVAGQSLPSFVAWEFEYIRTSRIVNNGRKSFGLLSEASVTSGEADPATLPLLNDLAVTLSAPVVDISLTSTWEPRIFRRPGTYASGVVAAPGQFFPISDVVYRRVSSQNTRKSGRGA